MLRALGHERIVSIDIDDGKLSAAAAAGAAATVHSRNSDAPENLKDITQGALYGAVDFVGSAETAELALDCLRKGGRLILVGLFGGEIKLSIARTILRAVTVQGSHLGSVEELNAVVALARKGQIKPIPIEPRPLSEVSRTLDELKLGWRRRQSRGRSSLVAAGEDWIRPRRHDKTDVILSVTIHRLAKAGNQ